MVDKRDEKRGIDEVEDGGHASKTKLNFYQPAAADVRWNHLKWLHGRGLCSAVLFVALEMHQLGFENCVLKVLSVSFGC